MRITIDRKALQNALDLLRVAIRARTPNPLLTCVRLVAADKSLVLTATDAEVTLAVQLSQVDVEREGEGSIAIPLERLVTVVAAEDRQMTMSLETDNHDKATLRFGDSQYAIFGYPTKDFPPVPEAHAVVASDKKAEFEVPAGALHAMIKRVDFCVSSETSRYAIAGVGIYKDASNIELVATDGRRLAYCYRKLTGPTHAGKTMVIAPVKGTALLKRICEDVDKEAPVQVMMTTSHLIARVGPYDFSSALVEGSFPPFRDIIPSDDMTKCKVTVRAHEFRNAVRRAAIMSSEETRAVGIACDPDTKLMRFWAGGAAGGAATVSFKMEEVHSPDGVFKTAFNNAFLQDAAAPFGEELVTLHFGGSGKACVVKNESDYVQVLMPCMAPTDQDGREWTEVAKV